MLPPVCVIHTVNMQTPSEYCSEMCFSAEQRCLFKHTVLSFLTVGVHHVFVGIACYVSQSKQTVSSHLWIMAHVLGTTQGCHTELSVTWVNEHMQTTAG